jgi:hypothetical protein
VFETILRPYCCWIDFVNLYKFSLIEEILLSKITIVVAEKLLLVGLAAGGITSSFLITGSHCV